MEDLADMVDENGECVVENFSVGRKGNPSQLTSHLALGHHPQLDRNLAAVF